MAACFSPQMQTKWSDLGAQPKGSIRHRIYRYLLFAISFLIVDVPFNLCVDFKLHGG